MNQPVPPPVSDPTEPPAVRPPPADEDMAAAVRLPGLLGRRREGLPVAAASPLVPTALSTFNRLTGRLDRNLDGHSETDAVVVVTEISGTPVEPVRGTVRDRRLSPPRP
jgi:hypothetical protein